MDENISRDRSKLIYLGINRDKENSLSSVQIKKDPVR